MKCSIFFVVYISVLVKGLRIIEEYFWRDFSGDIPCDAFPVGKDLEGNPKYIGQTFFSGVMLPVSINVNGDDIYMVYNRRVTPVTENVKVLCSRSPKKLKWILTNNTELGNLNKEFVRGGFQERLEFYIGRFTTYQGESYVGWIPFTYLSFNRILNFEREREPRYSFNYDVLVYDSSTKKFYSNVTIH